MNKQSREDLKKVLSITDLGAVQHILGIYVLREDNGSYILNQNTYDNKLLSKFGYDEPKPV
jgi:hypothetical protein